MQHVDLELLLPGLLALIDGALTRGVQF
jgi:hypothetical protein